MGILAEIAMKIMRKEEGMKEWIAMILKGMRTLFEMGLHGEFVDIALISGGRRMFLEVLYRSMTAGGIVLMILLLRILLRRVPKIYSYRLWILVLYRLLCPFTLVSSCSLLGIFDKADAGQIQVIENGTFSETQMREMSQKDQTVLPDMDAAAVDAGQSVYEGIHLSRNVNLALWVAFHVWEAGLLLMLFYGIVSLLFLGYRLKGAMKVRDNIYLSDYVPTPFVLGIIRPRIYLPSSLEEREWEYVVLHEKLHIRRGDHIVRILSFVTLAIYWFHPLIWVAFYLSGRDMEMSCDEAVIRKMDKDVRADYSTSLLQLSTGRWWSGGIPLAFGEKDVKKRIENVMCFQEPKLVAVGAAMAVLVAAVAVLGTDPVPSQALDTLRQSSDTLQELANTWAQAFCDRDGDRIAALCTEEKRGELEREDLLSGHAAGYSFGWSSPWPWDFQKDYRIIKCTPQDTVILYYAWTSDPHVTVWQEHLTWQQADAEYLVAESSITFLNDLSDSESFYMAYSMGINGTPIDYLTNGAGESLNENAMRDKADGRYYQDLFTPQTAAGFLLNLSKDEGKVVVRAGDAQADGSVRVSIDFVEDGRRKEVQMIQPYGQDGIWIPQN